MLNNLLRDKITLAILIVFLIIGIVASELLVLDEETLVAGCFIMFILFAYNSMGGMVANELDERASKISLELQKSYEAQKEFLKNQIESSRKKELLVLEIENLYKFSEAQILLVGNKRRSFLENKIAIQVNQQLKMISTKEKEIINTLQKDVINSFCNSIIDEFKQTSAANIRIQLVEESIIAIKNYIK